MMSRQRTATLAAMLVVALVLAACGGGDDPTATPQPEPTSTATTAPAPADPSPTATATTPPTATIAPSPTVAPTRSPAPTRPIATPTPTSTPTPEPTPTPDPVAERGELLRLALLTEESMPDGWTGDVEVRFEAPADQQTVCNLHEYEGRANLIAEAVADFDSPDGMRYFQQTITEYEMLDAFQALNFARNQISGCPEWTSPDGITFQIEPVVMDLPMGDALAYTLRFEFNGQPFEGRWVFMRVLNFVITTVYFGPQGTDNSDMEAALFDIVPRVQVAHNAVEEPDLYANPELAAFMATQLLSPREARAIQQPWLEFGVGLPQSEQRYNVCGLDLFTETFGAVEELQNEFLVDRDLGPFLWQSLATFEQEQIAIDALAHVRSVVSCPEFNDNNGNLWQALEYPELPFGDETHAVMVGYTSPEESYRGAFVFSRVGQQITVIVYLQRGDSLDPAIISAITESATNEVRRLLP